MEELGGMIINLSTMDKQVLIHDLSIYSRQYVADNRVAALVLTENAPP